MRLYPKLPGRRDPSFYDAKNDIEIEPEYGALLYALVRMGKPRVCIETGTYTGTSAEWIGKGLRDNHFGKLVTCDTETDCVTKARSRLGDLPVEVREQDGLKLIQESGMMEFVHIDGGEPKDRLRQIKAIGDHNILPGGIVVWHDAILWNPDLYEEFAPKHDWPHLVLPTPVGVAIFQRPE